MINEVENTNSLNQMSDLEHDKNELEMMRYRENHLSYNIGIIGIFASLMACFISLNSTNPITAVVVVKVLLNIVILLGGFLCIEKAKAYSKQASIGLMVFGAICFARIFPLSSVEPSSTQIISKLNPGILTTFLTSS